MNLGGEIGTGGFGASANYERNLGKGKVTFGASAHSKNGINLNAKYERNNLFGGNGNFEVGANAGKSGVEAHAKYTHKIDAGKVHIGAGVNIREGPNVNAGFEGKVFGGNLKTGLKWTFRRKIPRITFSWEKLLDALRKAARTRRLMKDLALLRSFRGMKLE